MKNYSIFSLVKESLKYHEGWQNALPNRPLKDKYDIIIIGGGGHGLATAYYLAKKHNLKNIAVIEKGWLGGGNTGRNTTIVRSNYTMDESAKIYELSVKLFEGLSNELNYNVMFSQRGLLHIAHNVHDMQEIGRRGHAIWLNGIDSEYLNPKQVSKMVPTLNMNGRYPVVGALLQRRGGTARHDAVAWGFARAASNLGVDIVQHAEVTKFLIKNGKAQGVEVRQGKELKKIMAGRIGVVTAGHSGVMANMAGFRLPIESFPLQALVSEPLKPIIDCVIMSNAVHVYVSQSDKGELVVGAGSDPYISYSQRGAFNSIEHIMSPLVELFPFVSRLKMLRQWAGIVDVTIDRSPIIAKTPVENLFFNCGWGTGGFKATPGSGYVFASSLAGKEMDPIAKPFSIERFYTGSLVDEGAAAAVAH
ncbi:MAG: sarcosine oxidase subunit beta family protein [Hydrotalea sp.]|nr:sarcosine oxidase subunit beta family protein [Hydrotalea sp.]